MAKTSSMYIRIDPDIKTEVETIYKRFGMSLNDAINVFIYQSRNVGGLPFNLCAEEQQGKFMPRFQSPMINMLGKYKGIFSSSEFMAQKQREKELEE
jgi:addiction module RelB/DinJ family antitoxin